MTEQSPSKYLCPLYGRDIALGKCLDINYERLGYLSDDCLDEITRFTGIREPDITKTCEACPNQPFGNDFGTVIFPDRDGTKGNRSRQSPSE